MAEKQFARSGTGDFDILADDDPLSELARIVGYDNRPAVQQLQDLERHQRLVRQDPVFDIEDELAREFDFYDAPGHAKVASAPASHVSAPIKQNDMLEEERAFTTIADGDEAQMAEIEPLPSQIHGEPDVIDGVETQVVHDGRVPELADADAWNAPEVYAEPGAYNAADDVTRIHEPTFERNTAEEASGATPVLHPVEEGFDLERELEMSIGYDDRLPGADVDPDPWSREIAEQTVPQIASADADLQSFGIEPVPTVDDNAADDVPMAGLSWDDTAYAAHEAFVPAENPAMPEERRPDMWSTQAGSEPLRSIKADEVVDARADLGGVDALLADIERFPVSQKEPAKAIPLQAAPADAGRKINYPFTPTFSRATPVASGNGPASQRAFATPFVASPVVAVPAVAEPVAAQTVDPELQDLSPPELEDVFLADTPASSAQEPEPDFDLDNFELDLSEIELDLDPSEFHLDATPVMQQPAMRAAVEDETPVVTQRPEPPAVVAPEPEDINETVLPFDPSMIADTDETLTTIADLEVPHLPVVEQEKHVPFQPDYELDIDAEIAQLFGGAARKSAARPAEAQADEGFAAVARPISVVHAAASQNTGRVEADFDEFEKAMEEDFRQSLNQRQDSAPQDDRRGYGSAYAQDDFSTEAGKGGSRRIGLMAAAVAGFLVLGGVGVYAWMGSDGTGIASGEPKIILADKSPVKVVPDEKGGKTVPNQDKAVYDRVAGAPDEDLQQNTLVSSTEEPIDVVQRTLTPETLPLEGSDDIEESGIVPLESEDAARLLPEAEADQSDVASDNAATAVSPRKVRTMIVKPDGTLVAREDPVAEPVTEVAAAETPVETALETPVATNDIPSPVVNTEVPVIAPQANADVATDGQPELRTQEQPVVEQPATGEPESALAAAANASVDETAPVRVVRTTTIGEQAPVPQSRPADQPVNVVGTVTDQGNVRPTPATAEVAPAQTTEVAAAETVTPAQPAVVPAGSYVVQIASLPSEAEAQRSFTTLSGKFASVIGGRGAEFRRAEIAGKGTYYRVRIPAGSRDEANALCARYKSAGGSCLVTR